MKKLLSLILALCMIFALSVPVLAEDVIKITVDGVFVDCAAYGQNPVIVEGRTLVPLRSVFEALGASVNWQNETRTVVSQRGNVNISLQVGSNALVVNGETKTIDVPASIMNDRTMVPVRAVAEAFGCEVSWDNEARCVVIKTASEEAVADGAVVNDTPESVVKKAYDAMLNLDIEKGKALYKNPDAAMGEFAGANSIQDIVSMTGNEAAVTEEQIKMVEKFTKDLMSLITYEITGSSVNGNVATVNVTTYTPNFDAVDLEAYMTEEAVMNLYIKVLGDMGYAIEDLYSITDTAEAEKIQNALSEAMLNYVIEVFFNAAKDAGNIAQEDVETLELIDGKWLIVE